MSTEKTKNKITSLSDEELLAIARGLINGKYFSSDQVENTNLMGSIFMPLALGAAKDVDFDDVGMIIGDYKNVFPREINGYPIFHSITFISKDNANFIRDKAKKIQEAQESVV